ncbi:MAG: acyltransferase domain-containing protein [Gammaproteobacteria bacterium]|nr:acyltransferase domain-containing protein [Gammaproteobacteria bacterium]
MNEYPAEISCGDWRLRVVTASDSNLLAKKTANPHDNSLRAPLSPAEAEGSGPSFGDTVGTVLVWNHEKPQTPRAELNDQKPGPRVLNLKSRASLTMMLAGVGDQYLNMGSGLYRSQTDFRQAFDLCAEHLQSLLTRDIRQDLFREQADGSTSNSSSAPDFRAMLRRGSLKSTQPEVEGLEATEIVQPLMFSFVYSLATMWQKVGLKPDALIGYSVGEYVAACLAGVFSLPDALAIVATRAKLIAKMPRGGLMAVPLSEKDCQPLLGESVHVAITSSPKQTILAGTPTSLEEVQLSLKARGIVARALPGSHAYHSPMLSPVSEHLVRHLNLVKLKKASIPVISNLTGKPLLESEATRPDYWSQHTCSTVRFYEGLSFLLQSGDMDLLEVGPGRSLGSFAMQHPLYNKTGIHNMLSTISGKWENLSDERVFLDSRGVFHLLGHNSVPGES